MILRYLYNTPLAQASYLVGCAATGEALIVDPNRDVEQYISLAEREGLRVTAVTETHIHADFISGARELAARTGATLYLSDEGTDDWKYAFAAEAGATLLTNGDSFKVGNILIQAIHTPGHTPEHLSFLVTDTAGADSPMGIFTGDFVFVGDVGRPDLLERAAGLIGTMEDGAQRLHRSLQWFRELPDYVQVWPGHGAGSACGRALGAVPQTTVGYEKLFNWALNIDEAHFVEAVLAGQPEPPVYFTQMKRANKLGAPLTTDLPVPQRLPDDALASELAKGMLVVDTREADIFSAGFVPGVINIPGGSNFLTWAGWLVPYDRPFSLIVDEKDIDRLTAELRLIGLDNMAGYWTPDVVTATNGLISFERDDTARFRQRIEHNGATLLDVRGASEYEAGHIAGSHHIPLGYLRERVSAVPSNVPMLVYCQGGGRSAIAASLLAAMGRGPIVDLRNGFSSWVAADYDIDHGPAST